MPLHEALDRVYGPADAQRWSYAISKAFGEAALLGYVTAQGADMRAVRLFNTVGRRQSPAYGMVLPRFVRQALNGEPLTVYGDGSQQRCFTHVADTVDALLRVMDSSTTGGRVLNVGLDRSDQHPRARRPRDRRHRGHCRARPWSRTRGSTAPASRSRRCAARIRRCCAS